MDETEALWQAAVREAMKHPRTPATAYSKADLEALAERDRRRGRLSVPGNPADREEVA